MSNILFKTNEEFSKKNLFYILELCEELLPQPRKAFITLAKSIREEKINSFLDQNVIDAFKYNKYGIEYECGDVLLTPGIRLTAQEGKGLISIPLIKKDEYHLVKKIVLKLIDELDLKKLQVSPVNFKSFFREHYRGNKRTPDFPGLYWLQYYGAEEFAKQGGKAILDNPYIEAQLIKDGVFIQVGKSPYDIHTPEGEALMINANAAMPPVVKD